MKTVAAKTSAEFETDLRNDYLGAAPAAIQAIKLSFQAFTKNVKDPAALQDLYRKVHSMTGNAGLVGLSAISRMAGALESLLHELGERPDRMNPSVLRTIAQSVDLLAELHVSPSPDNGDALAAAEVLAVDDEPIALRAMSHSLEKAKLKTITAPDATVALKLVAERQFDLIVTDIEMPGMKGTEFCSKLRSMPSYQTTPVVFVTSAADFEHRAQACLSGGNDLIAKPFLVSELAVKAVGLILKARLKSVATGA